MKILIIRLSAIGDIFFCTSLLPILKSRYPGCRITWLTESVGAGILDGHPLVDRILTVPRREMVRSLKAGRLIRFARAVARLSGTLREQHFDLIIDPQGLLKSGIWARMARGDRRIAIGAYDGSALFHDTVIRLPATDQPVILSEYRELARCLGTKAWKPVMNLHVKPEDQAAADSLLSGDSIQEPIVFCPFTTRPQKHWFDDQWAQLGDFLTGQGWGRVVILGGPDDGEQARRIAGLMSFQPVLAAGEPRPVGFALGIIARCKGLVGVDTGLTHAGIAFDRPTICLFGSTRPYVITGTPRARVLFHDLECAPCQRRPTCEERFDCMRLHLPGTVGRNLIELMQSQSDGSQT